jgi:hypothetical protein
MSRTSAASTGTGQDSAETFADRLVGKVSGSPLNDAYHGGTFVGADFTGDPARIV